MITGKCSYCGSPIKSGERFCHSCGAANEFYNAEDAQEFNMQYKMAKESTKIATIIMVGMVVFCLILCGTVFAVFSMVG